MTCNHPLFYYPKQKQKLNDFHFTTLVVYFLITEGSRPVLTSLHQSYLQPLLRGRSSLVLHICVFSLQRMTT